MRCLPALLTGQPAYLCRHSASGKRAPGVRRKDKSTDDRELWPHAISRHQSRDRTMLRLRKKTWPEVTAAVSRSRPCSTLDRMERTSRTKNTNARKLVWSSQTRNCLRKCTDHGGGVKENSWWKENHLAAPPKAADAWRQRTLRLHAASVSTLILLCPWLLPSSV